jgi:hypothetical protein
VLHPDDRGFSDGGVLEQDVLDPPRADVHAAACEITDLAGHPVIVMRQRDWD